jgi:N-acyl homoserine lactone hydrolase
VEVLTVFQGFPARSGRGYLGLSAAYLLKGERVLLYDTGGYGEREGLGARLRSLGVPPEAVEVVVLSHLHFDHAANFDLFPQAEILLHAAELAYAEGGGDAATLVHHLSALRQSRLRLVEGEEELLPGVRLLHLPGHTPGLLGLEVEGVGVFCSDAIKSRFDLSGPPAPPCTDPEAALRSRARLLGYPRLFPGHDGPLRRGAEGGFAPEGEVELSLRFPDGRGLRVILGRGGVECGWT